MMWDGVEWTVPLIIDTIIRTGFILGISWQVGIDYHPPLHFANNYITK
jgi:hypothetical protein